MFTITNPKRTWSIIVSGIVAALLLRSIAQQGLPSAMFLIILFLLVGIFMIYSFVMLFVE